MTQRASEPVDVGSDAMPGIGDIHSDGTLGESLETKPLVLEALSCPPVGSGWCWAVNKPRVSCGADAADST